MIKKDKKKIRTYANATARTIRREHRFETKLTELIDKLIKVKPIWRDYLEKIKEQLNIYEANTISKLSNPWFGEKGTIPTLLKQEPIDWKQLKIEINSAYSAGIQQLVTLLQHLENEFTKHLTHIERYLYIKPGKGIKGEYIRLTELLKKKSLISNKIHVEIRGNKIFKDSRLIQSCVLRGNYIEFLGYHFTNEKVAGIIKSDMKLEIKTFTDPYIYLLEARDYSGRSERKIRYLTGSAAASDVIIIKVLYPIEKVWIKVEKNRPTHFAIEGDITQENLIKRKGVYILHKKIKEL